MTKGGKGSFLQSIPFHLITLEGNEETRLKPVQDLLDTIGFQYEIHNFQRAKNPVRGCRESHMALYQYAAQKNLPWIAILEDNIRLASDESELPQLPSDDQYSFVKERLVALDGNKKDDWDVIVLGGFTFVPTAFSATDDPAVLVTRGTCHGTQAYVISRDCYLRMLNVTTDKPIDYLLHESEHAQIGRVLVMNPLVFTRDLRINSIVCPFNDSWRPFVYGPSAQRKLLKWGSFCADHSLTVSPHALLQVGIWSLFALVVFSCLRLFYSFYCFFTRVKQDNNGPRGRRRQATVYT